MVKQFIATTAVALLILGCSSKPKNHNEELTASGERVGTEAMDFNVKGSDSGKIDGLNTVFFEFDKSTLSQKEQKKLALNAMWLQNNSSKKLIVEGHADQIGSSEYNLSLSERRAHYVKNQLIKLGVKSSRLTITSYGEEKPLVLGDSEESMAKNRRANFVPN